MVKVPGGPFFMGCNERVDSKCDNDEKPGRTLNVSTYWVDKTEVTVAQYARCVRAGVCSADGLTMPYLDRERPESAESCNWGKPGREQHPINCVDWYQAGAYCAWAGKRLPTEAEWEKAARGTDRRKYPWGNTTYGVAARLANIKGESDGYVGTAPVGSYPRGASPYGALDMAGNVWEWVTDPVGNGRRVRGGSWSDEPGHQRASNRGLLPAQARDESVGVRCAR
jgi:serine/threonine-protein kinase